ncbi:YbaK/EbsC family protein [uncultured Endozoicomonas sp.]|uniref:aminoacyl-tRNA deacylase n=1 Tax=uncultured Endozoicomonas sp. TaxID=432652 RepID=UPI0026204EEA|nr:YbaK/EbsC family protein [uncultured Endozoicomonas sp.]
MSIAPRLKSFLNRNDIDYEVVSHPYSDGALNTANVACVPAKNMTKAVVLKDEQGYVMTILPSVNKLMLRWVNSKLNRHLHLVSEHGLEELFPDCESGAIPAIGTAYGIKTCWDDELNAVQDLYFQGGNHRELVHLQREQFKQLLQGEPHAAISCPPEEMEAYSKE